MTLSIIIHDLELDGAGASVGAGEVAHVLAVVAVRVALVHVASLGRTGERCLTMFNSQIKWIFQQVVSTYTLDA